MTQELAEFDYITRKQAQPTLFDCSINEFEMCKAFWKQVLELRSANVIPEFAIYHNSNNQKIGGRAGIIAGSKAKAVGVMPGVLDYTVTGIGHLEAKIWYVDNESGKIARSYWKPEQHRFAHYAKSKGEKIAEFLTPKQGIDILLEWLK